MLTKWHPKAFEIEAGRCLWRRKASRKEVSKECRKHITEKTSRRCRHAVKKEGLQSCCLDPFSDLWPKAPQGDPKDPPGHPPAPINKPMLFKHSSLDASVAHFLPKCTPLERYKTHTETIAKTIRKCWPWAPNGLPKVCIFLVSLCSHFTLSPVTFHPPFTSPFHPWGTLSLFHL